MVAITGGQAPAMAAPWPTSNVNATYNGYYPEQSGWDLRSINAFCAPWDASQPLWWRQQFGWAGLCEPWLGTSTSYGYCGTCINVLPFRYVTNRATGKWIVARIVDKCTGGSVELDYETVFSKIDDNDGHGFDKGYLKVDYKFISCYRASRPGGAEPGRM
ncbi:unnamed protein product [Urochloa decumbens]|uniref:Barwin domain-containing protein n=1 Tax=Urochloa decumbens TaxID=240449 RepID=A0ABC9AU86_9POAL